MFNARENKLQANFFKQQENNFLDVFNDFDPNRDYKQKNNNVHERLYLSDKEPIKLHKSGNNTTSDFFKSKTVTSEK